MAENNVACGASLIRIMFELVSIGEGWLKIKELLDIEEMLNFEKVSKDKLFLCVPYYSRYWVTNEETGEKISPVEGKS